MAERSSSGGARRAALIATAVALPIVVLLAFALTSRKSTDDGAQPTSTLQPTGVLGPVTEAPVSADAATTAACAQVISQLPTTLNGRAARLVRGGGPLVKAWGQPPVVLRCGVSRPAELKVNADDLLLVIGLDADSNAVWLPKADSNGRVFTVIDRAVYLEMSLPNSGSAGEVLPLISQAVAKVLPAICEPQTNGTGSLVPDDRLCTHRK